MYMFFVSFRPPICLLLVIWGTSTEEYTTTATFRMQQAMNVLATCAEKCIVNIDNKNWSTALFTLTKQQAGTATLRDSPLKKDDKPNYLGVNFERLGNLSSKKLRLGQEESWLSCENCQDLPGEQMRKLLRTALHPHISAVPRHCHHQTKPQETTPVQALPKPVLQAHTTSRRHQSSGTISELGH